MMNLGYACINTTLANETPRITTNRGMIKKTFLEKGLEYAGDLSFSNISDLLVILRWNIKNNIRFFRVSSDIFPWANHYNIKIICTGAAIAFLTKRQAPINDLIDPINHLYAGHDKQLHSYLSEANFQLSMVCHSIFGMTNDEILYD